MNQQLLAEIGRTQRLEILNSLKRSKGMSVNELVRKMKMSYMGIKQHCLTLQRDGYLDTWRRPQKMGRPEMVYRLTRRTPRSLSSPTATNSLSSSSSPVQEIYGPNAPEKLLYNVFERKTAALEGQSEGRQRGRSRQMAGPASAMGRVICPNSCPRKRRAAPDFGMSFADPESDRPLPDCGPARAGHVRGGLLGTTVRREEPATRAYTSARFTSAV